MSNDKTTPQFDFSEFSDVFEEAAATSRDKTEKLDIKLATDTKEMEVVKIGRGEMKYKETDKETGEEKEITVPKMWALLRLIDGKFSGETTFKSYRLSKNAKDWQTALQDLKTMGVAKVATQDDLNDDENLATAYGNRVAVSVYVSKSKKNGKEYGNVNIQRRTSTAQERA